ncbi:CLUMA_CG005390, isoform A [Clunio marinus]|uniref:CLUMA_CG005390, isoform A n=1 Tax=Clunio marinus TaxID=568069 RepID=A0A1J1HWM3_9DIPT|nr:CLUMA_CG005390, isoform A [Clunio marinus]
MDELIKQNTKDPVAKILRSVHGELLGLNILMVFLIINGSNHIKHTFEVIGVLHMIFLSNSTIKIKSSSLICR